MRGLVVGPVDLKLGENTYTQNLYVAPIEDQMLLHVGIDFLKRHGMSINLKESCECTNESVKYKNLSLSKYG